MSIRPGRGPVPGEAELVERRLLGRCLRERIVYQAHQDVVAARVDPPDAHHRRVRDRRGQVRGNEPTRGGPATLGGLRLPVDCGVTPRQSASLHLLAKPLDLALLALDQIKQALAVGGAERRGRARGRAARSQLALGVDDDRLGGAVDRPAADPGDEGAGLLALGPDPDRLRLPGLAGVGDVDVVRAGGQVLAGARAEGDVATTRWRCRAAR